MAKWFFKVGKVYQKFVQIKSLHWVIIYGAWIFEMPQKLRTVIIIISNQHWSVWKKVKMYTCSIILTKPLEKWLSIPAKLQL